MQRYKKGAVTRQVKVVKPSPEQSVGLEEEFEGKLHDSWARCSSRCSEGSRADVLRNEARCARNSTDSCRCGTRKLCCAQSADVRVVKHVERLPDESQTDALGDVHITRHAWIQGNRPRQIESVSAESRRSICGRVAVVVQIEINQPGIGQPRLRRQNSTELPAPENGLRRSRQSPCIIQLPYAT